MKLAESLVHTRIHALTDGSASSIEDALDQWEGEQAILKDLYANYDLYRINNARLVSALQTAHKLIKKINSTSALFIPQDTAGNIADFLQEYKTLAENIKEL